MQKLVTSAEVLERYSMTAQTLIAWVKDEKLGFPRPIKIRGRNFWREDDLFAFEASMQAQVA